MTDQRVIRRINEGRLFERSCESLLGICVGLLADRRLNVEEVRFLELWLRENELIATVWPGSVVARRIAEVVADGTITESELEYLKTILSELIGGGLEGTGAVGGTSTSLPIDQGCTVVFPGRSFCFTGKFIYGTRQLCETAVKSRGGFSHSVVTKELDYLVIGKLVSSDWVCTTYGRKIEAAMDARASGRGVRIVSEEQWVRDLG